MTRAFRSEWLKLRRRGMYFGIGLLSFVGGGLVTLLTVLQQPLTGPQSRVHGPTGAPLSFAQINASDGLARLVSRGSTVMGLVALVLCATSFASEFSQGTIRNLAVRAPRRLQLLAGKMAGNATFLTLGVIAAVALGVAVAFAFAPSHHISTAAWSLWPLGAAAVRLAATTIGWGVVGATLGTLFRTAAPAIGVGVGYGLLFESFLTAAWSGGARWLPGQLLSALASGGTDTTSALRAASLLAVYLCAAATAGAVVFVRRDILS